MSQTCPPRTDAARCPATRPQRVGGPLAGGAAIVLLALVTTLVIGFGVTAVLLSTLVAAVAATLVVRRPLGHLLAGAGLWVAQPYLPGDQVRLYVPALRRVIEAEVVRVGAANTTLFDGTHTLVVANATMLRRPPKTSTHA